MSRVIRDSGVTYEMGMIELTKEQELEYFREHGYHEISRARSVKKQFWRT